MQAQSRLRMRVWRTALILVGTASIVWGQQSAFVQRSGGTLMLNGSPFRFGGTNSYPLMYSSQPTVSQILQTVANSKLKVVRMWVFCDSTCGDGFFFQYWNTANGAPAYNDLSRGLNNVDLTVNEANQLGIKLILTLTNNWTDFGGMDTYVKWHNGQYHDQFYTDPAILQWYESWVNHVLTHVNTVQGPSFGVAYKDDPTIMAWELANEPECGGSGPPTGFPTSGSCTNTTLINWITAASQYVKSIDPNHLVSVGDEGFFCEPGTSDYFTDCANGVDSRGFSSLPNIDFVGFHLYPDLWGKSISWGATYITDHLSEAVTLSKPVYMGEFGLLSANAKEAVYYDWTNLIFNSGGTGAMFWDILPGTPAPANAEPASTFDEEAGSPVFFLMSDFAQLMTGASQPLPPVAGNEWTTTPAGQPATLDVLSNDVAYSGATIDPSTIDLDPATPGQQTSLAVTGGVFSVTGQAVAFTPQSGFAGTASGSYTVEDSNQQVSNVGYLFATVNPMQTGWATVDSFESGTDGWGPAPNSSPQSAGTLALSKAVHTDGSSALQVNVTAPGWFGVTFAKPVDLSAWPALALDVITTSVGGYSAFAFQSGANYNWCQSSSWVPLSLFATTTLSLQLQSSQLTCYGGPSADLTSVHTLFVNLPNVGIYYLDNLRVMPASGSATPLPAITSVSNSAGGQPGAAAGTYISIYGANFAPGASVGAIWSDYVVNGQLPTSLAGVSVTMGGMAAYVYYVSPTQINVLAPNLGTGNLSVTVTTPAGTSASFPAAVAAAQPAFFAWPGNQVVATDANYNWLVTNGTFPGTTTVPARPGQTVILWGTGFGPTTPAAPAGQITPPNLYSVDGVEVTVGTVGLRASATALSPGSAGLYQVVIQLPADLANGIYPIVATVNGLPSPAGLNLAVQQ